MGDTRRVQNDLVLFNLDQDVAVQLHETEVGQTIEEQHSNRWQAAWN